MHGRGVDSFLGVAIKGDVIEKAVGRGKIVLGWIRLVEGELTDSSENE
jgi:hypothetical protein